MSELDDPRAQELLDRYMAELQAGRAPDRSPILAERPDLASALDCLDQLEQIAPDPTRYDPDLADTMPPGPPSPSVVTARPVQRIGKYAIERELGRGGMGVVYLARDTELNRPVAVKMILAGSMASDDYRQRFQAEVRTSAQLDHEGIVRVYDSGEFNGLPYLTMQYVDGPSLSEHLRSRRPDAEAAVRLLIQLARTAAYLHAHGIVHRDLKPANILLQDADCGVRTAELKTIGSEFRTPHSELRTAKISDFGLAKLLEEENVATRTGVIVGTPSYMAPEQARGDSRSVGPAADIYALGAILYELLTGRPPFIGETSLATLLQVMDDEPRSPRRFNPKVHPDLEAICLKCLEKSPERRFASAAKLADALERHLKGEDVPEARPGPWQAFARWIRRNPALASRIAILITCVVILCAKSALSGSMDYSKTFVSVRLPHLGVVFAIWLALSWLFQRFIRRQRGLITVPYIWAVADVAILTATLLVTDSLVSPIDIGFPLLIAAAGLWLRPRLVWFTFCCCAVAYGAATLIVMAHGYHEQLHRHIIFLAGLVTMAFLVVHQVQRFRALSRYYEGR